MTASLLNMSSEMILQLNRQAMKELTGGNPVGAINSLNQALTSLAPIPQSPLKSRLLLICYNNRACFHRKMGQLDRALSNLYKAVELERRVRCDVPNIVNVHLNICGILSDLGEHEKALRHALKAVCIIKKNYEEGYRAMLASAYENLGDQY